VIIVVEVLRVAVASRLLQRTCQFSAPRKAETFYWSMPTIDPETATDFTQLRNEKLDGRAGYTSIKLEG
jgi:hypothetical protein